MISRATPSERRIIRMSRELYPSAVTILEQFQRPFPYDRTLSIVSLVSRLVIFVRFVAIIELERLEKTVRRNLGASSIDPLLIDGLPISAPFAAREKFRSDLTPYA